MLGNFELAIGIRNLWLNSPSKPLLHHEEDLSTKGSSPQAPPWLPAPNEDARRQGDCEEPSQEGPETSRRLNPPETLRNSENFRRVLEEGARNRQGGIVLVGFKGPAEQPRLGLVVSRQCGNAVTRNRIKRRLRHAASDLQLQPGTDYVIIASRQVADAPYRQLRNWLERALEGVTRD